MTTKSDSKLSSCSSSAFDTGRNSAGSESSSFETGSSHSTTTSAVESLPLAKPIELTPNKFQPRKTPVSPYANINAGPHVRYLIDCLNQAHQRIEKLREEVRKLRERAKVKRNEADPPRPTGPLPRGSQ